MSLIALLGGSFDPPHIGHRALCVAALQSCSVDEVWLLPTYVHYFGKELAPFKDRLAMCEIMADALGDRVRVCAIESELTAPTGRMLHTLEALEEAWPDHEFRLMIGADILQETERWYAWDKVAALAPPLIFRRVGCPGGTLPAPPEVSSSKIRQRLVAGESPRPWISEQVQSYIEAKGMYRS